MSSIQVADETFVAAPADRVAAIVGDRSRWRGWWPHLRLDVAQDRGVQGIRWRVGGPVTGTMEVWLQPRLDGVVVHYFLHAEPADAPDTPRARRRTPTALTHHSRVAGRRMTRELKRRAEADRAIGDPATAVAPTALAPTAAPTPAAVTTSTGAESLSAASAVDDDAVGHRRTTTSEVAQ